MKKINRSTVLAAFRELINSNKRPLNWNAFSSPNSPHHELYQHVRTLLLADQLNTGGYTELPLSPDDNIHIDHFRKKNMFPQLTFEWENFVIDEVNNDKYGADYKDKNVSIEDYDNLISPVLDNPEYYLTYIQDGTMIPRRDLTELAEIKRAEETIRLFNLNHPDLVHRREGLIKVLQQLKSNNISKEETFDSMSVAGFHSLIDYVYGRHNP